MPEPTTIQNLEDLSPEAIDSLALGDAPAEGDAAGGASKPEPQTDDAAKPDTEPSEAGEPGAIDLTKPNRSESDASEDDGQKIEIPGIGEIAVSDIRDGLAAREGLTRKFQDVAAQRKEVEALKAHYEQTMADAGVLLEIQRQFDSATTPEAQVGFFAELASHSSLSSPLKLAAECVLFWPTSTGSSLGAF